MVYLEGGTRAVPRRARTCMYVFYTCMHNSISSGCVVATYAGTLKWAFPDPLRFLFYRNGSFQILSVLRFAKNGRSQILSVPRFVRGGGHPYVPYPWDRHPYYGCVDCTPPLRSPILGHLPDGSGGRAVGQL